MEVGEADTLHWAGLVRSDNRDLALWPLGQWSVSVVACPALACPALACDKGNGEGGAQLSGDPETIPA
jgi:hypothetical protein